MVSLEETYWEIAKGERTPNLRLTEEEVIAAYKEAGFQVLYSVVTTVDESARFKLNDCKKLQFIAAKLEN